MKAIQAKYEIITNLDGDKILKDIELVARTCYKSEDKITDDSAKKMVANLIKHGHEAMIEHSQMSVRFYCDRGVSHEMVRHREASFGQESTRYCNYSKDKFDNSVTYIDLSTGMELDTKVKELPIDAKQRILNEWIEACEDAERHYFNMLKFGATPQIARSVLNNSTKTEIVITANMREWRHIFKLRADAPAHPQMRELMIPLLHELQSKVPVLFDDIKL